jgi:hypothetical protein
VITSTFRLANHWSATRNRQGYPGTHRLWYIVLTEIVYNIYACVAIYPWQFALVKLLFLRSRNGKFYLLNLKINPWLGCVRPTVYIYRSEYLGTKLYQRLVLKGIWYSRDCQLIFSWKFVIWSISTCSFQIFNEKYTFVT